MRLAHVCCAALLPVVLGCAEQAPKQHVDLLLINAHILSADAMFRSHRNMAVRDGRIVAIGDDDLREQYDAAQIIDGRGRTVVPGFIDTHVHVSGEPRWHIDLSAARSIDALKVLVKAKAAQLPAGHWITGYGWSEDQLVDGRKPTRTDLDATTTDNPVILTRAGGHSAVVNSHALRLAAVDRDTIDPEGGVIERDAKGEPTGVIRERQDIVARLAPEATDAELRTSFVAALRALFAHGITSIVQASDSVAHYQEWQRIYAAERGRLPRAAVQLRWEAPPLMQAFRQAAGPGDAFLRPGAIKIFVDGGFTGPAAYTLQPYQGQGDYRGTLNLTPELLAETVQHAHQAGWQLGLHTIGDGAIVLAVDVLEAALKAHPRSDHRHYLNHFSIMPPEATMAKMAANGLLITQQPNFTYTLEGRYREYLDDDRLEHNNPLRTPLSQGIQLAISSDSLPVGPLLGIYAAVTRKGASGTVHGADEALTVAEAIQAYTRFAAYFTFEEAEKGSLELGKVADFVVLSADPLTTAPDELLTITVEETYVGGALMYQRAVAP